METIYRQTVIRMEESLYQRIKASAKRQHRSINGLMVCTLDENIKDTRPKLSLKDYEPDFVLSNLGKTLSGISTDNTINDPKVKYILAK